MIPDNSVDAVVTDPPYELGFMGKKWDKTGIANNVDMWHEVLRVLKPGGHLLAFGGTRTYHRMACAIEDAGFEIRDQMQWIYGCLSEDTECLTQNGWKTYDKLADTDSVLQWDCETEELSWTHPLAVLTYPAPPTMIHLQNRHIDQLLTANHRVYGKFRKHSRNPKSQNYTIELAGNLKKHWQKSLPLGGKLLNGIHNSDAYMIGWWLTDAWVHGDGKACMFSQAKPKTIEKLRNGLQNSDCKFSEYIKKHSSVNQKDEHTFYVTGKLADYLLQNFPKRKLTVDVLQWDYESRLNLLKGLMDGDGSYTADQSCNRYAVAFWSQRRERLDIFQALCLSLNMRSCIDYHKGCVYFNINKNTSQLQMKHVCEQISYDGDIVWCIQVPNHAFVARRNGKSFITGNSGFTKSMDISKAIDKKAGIWRGKAGNVISKSGSMSAPNYERPPKGEPITELAKQWNGFGTALKPANEPICLARKPLTKKSVVDNILRYGTGGINIDGCRIPTTQLHVQKAKGSNGTQGIYGDFNTMGVYAPNPHGRFPSNVILDENASQLLDAQTGTLKSRFFYCAKASRKERDQGLDDHNNHPTVKPVDLMRYLVSLVTKEGQVVLDPFMGSGTTGVACVLNHRDFIGIDKDKHYCDIAERRIAYSI
jgi:site-specific DNA-methyltransferase (adenine-specific)